MKPASLRRWREERRWSKAKASEQLGIGRNTYAAYEQDGAAIPRAVALACAAIAFGLPPME